MSDGYEIILEDCFNYEPPTKQYIDYLEVKITGLEECNAEMHYATNQEKPNDVKVAISTVLDHFSLYIQGTEVEAIGSGVFPDDIFTAIIKTTTPEMVYSIKEALEVAYKAAKKVSENSEQESSDNH